MVLVYVPRFIETYYAVVGWYSLNACSFLKGKERRVDMWEKEHGKKGLGDVGGGEAILGCNIWETNIKICL